MKKVDQKYLAYIEGNPGTSSNELAKALDINKTTAAARLSLMHSDGLLVRERVSLDRRMEYQYFVLAERKEDSHPTPVSPEMEKQIDEAAKADRIVMPEVTTESLVERIKTEMVKIKQTPDYALLSLVDKFVTTLAEEISVRLRPLLIEKLTGAVGAMTDEITKSIPKKEKAKLHRVLVCGCLDKQGQMLKQEYAGMLEIDWVTVEESADVWRNKARNAFAVLVMADFVSHKHIEMIKETGAEPEVHKGGYSRLRDRLLELSIN